MVRHHSNEERRLSSNGPTRRHVISAAAAGIPLALAGCLGNGEDASPSDDPDAEGDLRWAGSIPVQSLDPHFESAAASAQVLENITQGLVRVNWDYELEGLLAESWESSEDNMEITFSLREGVQFHDGTEFTAEDVLASYTRIQEEEGLAADYLSLVDSMDAPDDHTFSLELSEPFAPLLFRMATSHMHIIPAEQAEQGSVDEPIGTGPFQFESHELDSEFVMVRFDDYWDDEYPLLDRITKTEIPDNDVRLDRFEAGEADFANDIPPRHADRLEDDPDVEFIERFPQSLTYLGMNCTQEPFDDRDARIALEYTIDREEVIEAALYGNGRVANSPATPDSEWEHPSLEPRQQDFERAQEHLEAAGYPDGYEATFKIPEDYNDQVTAAQIIQSSASEVGIELDIQLITWSNWLSDVFEERNFEATTSSYLALWYPDAGFHRPLHSEGAFFFTGWEDEEYNDLIDEARSLYDMADRAPMYHEAAEMLQERRSGHIMLYWMPTLMARYEHYQGEIMSPDGSTFRFEDTWLE